MPQLYGTTPEFGIANPESGILIEKLDFGGQMETYEQKNHLGRVIGVHVIDEYLDFSMSGALPLNGEYSLKMGSSLALNNAIPDIWNVNPDATTVFVNSVKRSLSNSGPVTLDVGGKIYAFGQAAQGE